MSETQLFSPSLISPKVLAALPKGYTARPLQRTDFAAGHLDPIQDLAYVGDISEAQWLERFDLMARNEGTYYVVVIVDGEGRIVGTGTLLVEKKFLYKLGTQGHIEDIAIKADQQGKKFGLRLIEALDYVAEKVGCYKTILDTSEEKEGFYEKCGYEKAGSEMHHFFDAEAEERGI